MSHKPKTPATKTLTLSEDEVVLVELYRALNLDEAEALRRLATPLSAPILPVGQELHANMPIAAEILVVAEQPAVEPVKSR